MDFCKKCVAHSFRVIYRTSRVGSAENNSKIECQNFRKFIINKIK
jgi:hypothetical protein